MRRILSVILCAFALSCSKIDDQEINVYDFGKVEFEEPFRGFLKKQPRILRQSLSIPPFCWFQPDTLTISKTFVVEFNEDAVRSNSAVYLQFVDNDYNKNEYIDFYLNDECLDDNLLKITADSLYKELTIKCRVNPKMGKKLAEGKVLVASYELDQINSSTINQEKVHLADWEVEQGYNIPWGLWILWFLLLILGLNLVILCVGCLGFLLYCLIFYIVPLIVQSSAGAIQSAICSIYSLPDFLFNIVFKLLPSNMQNFLIQIMPSKSNFKVGKVKAANKVQQRKLDEIRRNTGKDLRYKYGEVDFTPVAEYQVKLPGSLDKCIPDTLDPRSKVSRAQEIAGNKMLESAKGRKKIARYVGKFPTRLTFDDYIAWKDDRLNIGKPNHNPLTPHETIDGKYIQWVPKKYHDAANGWDGFAHSGGVSLLKYIRTYLVNK